MTHVAIFHLKRLWVFDTENRPSILAKCARCGHSFGHHNPLSCVEAQCRCSEFMVDLYEEIKAGRKTSEWRDHKVYWDNILIKKPSKAWFVVGYPKNNLLPRLEADIVKIILHEDSHQFEIQFTNVKEVTKSAFYGSKKQ